MFGYVNSKALTYRPRTLRHAIFRAISDKVPVQIVPIFKIDV